MNNLTVKKNIEKLRKEIGLSQEEVAEKLGISVTSYRKFEKGPTSIINSKVFAIAKILNVSDKDLLLCDDSYENYLQQKVTLLQEEFVLKESKEVSILKEQLLILQEENKHLKAWLDDKDEIIRMLRAKK